MDPDLLQAFELVLNRLHALSERSRSLIDAMSRGERLGDAELSGILLELDAVDSHRQRLQTMMLTMWQMIGEEVAH